MPPQLPPALAAIVAGVAGAAELTLQAKAHVIQPAGQALVLTGRAAIALLALAVRGAMGARRMFHSCRLQIRLHQKTGGRQSLCLAALLAARIRQCPLFVLGTVLRPIYLDRPLPQGALGGLAGEAQ